MCVLLKVYMYRGCRDNTVGKTLIVSNRMIAIIHKVNEFRNNGTLSYEYMGCYNERYTYFRKYIYIYIYIFMYI